jgi:hypothetical protein
LNPRKGFRSSLLEQHAIANKIGGAKFRQAPLTDAEKFTGTSNPKIFLGKMESIGRGDQRFEPLLRRRLLRTFTRMSRGD